MFLVEYRALLKRLNPLCTRALEAAGVIFLEPKANKDGGAGVRLKK